MGWHGDVERDPNNVLRPSNNQYTLQINKDGVILFHVNVNINNDKESNKIESNFSRGNLIHY